MVTIDTVEGTVDGRVSYHYDFFADVLYLRLLAEEQTESFGDMDNDGDILLRAQDDDRPVGLTVISWWKRCGDGSPPDSLRELSSRIEPWAEKVAAAQVTSSG